jgi:hypothetical protein
MERWEAAYDAEAGYPRAIEGKSARSLTKSLHCAGNTEVIARVREPELRTHASSISPVPSVRRWQAADAVRKKRLFMCLDGRTNGEAEERDHGPGTRRSIPMDSSPSARDSQFPEMPAARAYLPTPQCTGPNWNVARSRVSTMIPE